MLSDKPMKNIGDYAEHKTNSIMFGVGKSDLTEGKESLLFSFALTRKSVLTEQQLNDIITRIADKHL